MTHNFTQRNLKCVSRSDILLLGLVFTRSKWLYNVQSNLKSLQMDENPAKPIPATNICKANDGAITAFDAAPVVVEDADVAVLLTVLVVVEDTLTPVAEEVSLDVVV
jgi:hypothetical protein